MATEAVRAECPTGNMPDMGALCLFLDAVIFNFNFNFNFDFDFDLCKGKQGHRYRAYWSNTRKEEWQPIRPTVLFSGCGMRALHKTEDELLTDHGADPPLRNRRLNESLPRPDRIRPQSRDQYRNALLCLLQDKQMVRTIALILFSLCVLLLGPDSQGHNTRSLSPAIFALLYRPNVFRWCSHHGL